MHHEAGAFVADAVALRHADVVEKHLCGFRAAHAELVQMRAEADARRGHRHHDQRLVDVRLVVRSVGQQADEVSARRVGDPHLAAVDHVVVTVLARRGFQPGNVRTGTDFRHADAVNLLAGDRRAKELFAQFIRAEPRQRRGAHVGLYTDRHRDTAAVNGAELFGGNNRVAVIKAHAAEFFRFGNAQQAEVAGLAEYFVDRKASGLFPFIDVRVDLVFDKLADGAAQCFVFRCEDHFYCSP